MREIPIRHRVLPCPVCREHSLTGYSFDLSETELEYNQHFLPRAKDKQEEDGGYIVDNITLFNNYFCPGDLYVYTGNIISHDQQLTFDENVFYEIRRYLRTDQSQYMGLRISYLMNALQFNGLNPQDMFPGHGSHSNAPRVANAVSELIDNCDPITFESRKVFKLFRKLTEDFQWNPFEKIMDGFYKNRIFMTSILEMQLADTLYMLHRSLEKRSRLFSYHSMYSRLEELQAIFRRQPALNTDLVSDILFQCLKLSGFIKDSRKTTLLRTAFEASEYMKTVNLRIGAKLDRKLHVLSRNPDVLFYLNIQLGRELEIENPMAKDLLRFLIKRLDSNADYKYPKSDKESVRAMRIGKQLSKHCEKLKIHMVG